MWSIFVIMAFAATGLSLRCYEGTLQGLTNNTRTEEKMTGCHWQSAYETFCCCQFDGCNEWKADGTQYKESEMVSLNTFTVPSASPRRKSQWSDDFVNTHKTSPTTPVAQNDEIQLH
ncbi:hypothetical protein KIN20_011931 [Parelaphostrongylus tenuis]|uniref:Uncharacterized protein n=1 Tax=Parelaphostrongylus tenuis TaxID=148309 RepID=A0AAD5MSQ9_PARTN|nr:hypothetical protein KIN20_011931 [Parelaphostrongylus tenuis]